MKLYPAIDIREGRAVRLLRGDYEKMTVYAEDPVAVALSFREAGAENLHVVDLDGAKDGTTANFDLIGRIIAETGLYVEVGGGIRDEERIARYLDAGAGRVILGTAALKNPAFAEAAAARFGEAIAVGVDAKDGKVATHGWLTVSDVDSFDFCREMYGRGVKTVIYTDIACDGAMSGTNLPAYARLSEIKGLNVIASGGISSIEELKKLSEMGVYGAILGKSIYTGAIDLVEALCAVK